MRRSRAAAQRPASCSTRPPSWQAHGAVSVHAPAACSRPCRLAPAALRRAAPCSARTLRVAATPAVEAAAAFHGLAQAGGVTVTPGIAALEGRAGLGLHAQQACSKGQVLLRVPRGLAVTIDYEAGLSLPDGPWPRLRDGLAAAEPLPWDLLQALALLDSMSGDGTPFWQAYCDRFLPEPDRLALPMCLALERMQQLQHAALQGPATQQQARLAGLFPEMSQPLGPDLPSWMQWAFACVRSRAFKMGESFAFVPFLDLANHSDAHNADFRLAPDGTSYELFAADDIAAGSEVCITYSGPEGYTNQRWMAQYGFVPNGGNMADRIAFEGVEGAAPLSLASLQDVLGDELFLTAAKGTNKYLYAALKSLPLVDEAASAEQASAGKRTAAQLLQQTTALFQGCPTSLEEDESLLKGDGTRLLLEDCRQHAALLYRIERKRLLEHCRVLLQAYART